MLPFPNSFLIPEKLFLGGGPFCIGVLFLCMIDICRERNKQKIDQNEVLYFFSELEQWSFVLFLRARTKFLWVLIHFDATTNQNFKWYCPHEFFNSYWSSLPYFEYTNKQIYILKIEMLIYIAKFFSHLTSRQHFWFRLKLGRYLSQDVILNFSKKCLLYNL